MAFFKIVVAVDMTDVKVTPTGKLPKRERERITEGIEDCLNRAPADLNVWHAEVLDIELGAN